LVATPEVEGQPKATKEMVIVEDRGSVRKEMKPKLKNSRKRKPRRRKNRKCRRREEDRSALE